MKTRPKIILDFSIAAIIFMVAILELISWHFSAGKPATIIDVGNNYLIYFQPLFSTCVIWLFSLYFLFKIFRFKMCIYTEIVTVMYFAVQTFNLSAYIFQFGLDFYNQYIYPFFLFSIIFIILIKVIRWRSYNHL